MRLESEEINLTTKERIEAQRKKTITAEVESAEEEKKLLNVQEEISQTKEEKLQEEREDEYNILKKRFDFIGTINLIKSIIYRRWWSIADLSLSNEEGHYLSIADTNWIIIIWNDSISLTPKGKYILKLYETKSEEQIYDL